jgi:hypothetical protein
MAKRKGKNIEDTNRVIRSHQNKGEQTAKWPKGKGKNRQIMIYKKPHRKSETEQHEPIKNRGLIQVLRKGKQFLLHLWDPSCYSCYKSGDMSWTRKGPVICLEWGRDLFYVLNEERTGDMSWMGKEPMICLEWGKDRWYVLNEERTGDMSWMRKGPVICLEWRKDRWYVLNDERTGCWLRQTDISVVKNVFELFAKLLSIIDCPYLITLWFSLTLISKIIRILKGI